MTDFPADMPPNIRQLITGANDVWQALVSNLPEVPEVLMGIAAVLDFGQSVGLAVDECLGDGSDTGLEGMAGVSLGMAVIAEWLARVAPDEAAVRPWRGKGNL